MIIRDNLCQFCTKTYAMTPHRKSGRDSSDERLQHMVSMRNKKKLSLNYHQIPLLSKALKDTFEVLNFGTVVILDTCKIEVSPP